MVVALEKADVGIPGGVCGSGNAPGSRFTVASVGIATSLLQKATRAECAKS